jgi:hypothetical protein
MNTPLVNALRTTALTAFAPFQPVRVPGRQERYRCNDGSEFLLRTAPKGTLMTKADGPNAGDRMWIERGGHQSIVIAVPAKNGTSTEVYRVPTDRVVADLNEHHRRFCETHPPESATKLRAIAFGGDPASIGRGFRIKYREFLVEQGESASVEAPAAPPSGPARGLLDMEEVIALRSRLSREFGVDPIEIGITIEVCGGRLAFHV